MKSHGNHHGIPTFLHLFAAENPMIKVQPLAGDDPRLPEVMARFRALGRLLAIALRESFVVPLPLAAARRKSW